MLLGEGNCSVKMESERRAFDWREPCIRYDDGAILQAALQIHIERAVTAFLAHSAPESTLACFPFAAVAPPNHISKADSAHRVLQPCTLCKHVLEGC